MARGAGKDPSEFVSKSGTLPSGTTYKETRMGRAAGKDWKKPSGGKMTATTGGGLKAKPSKKRGGRKPKMGY